jgi:hypothetical protein
MRSSIPFDTHAFVKKLVAAGVPEQQAEVHAEIMAEVVIERLATKDDLRGLEDRLDTKLKDLEMRLTFRFGAMLAATVAITTALVKLL